ncbi:Para-nitrobenzyl esterase [Streptomyces sp. enrichment culture]
MTRPLAALAATALLPALALAASTSTAGSVSGPGADRAAPVVRTDGGLVQGVTADRADRFLGLPYAAPPVRDLRFAPPAAPASWKGVREADQQSPACLQFQPSGIREEQAVSEDCLYLDVYRPSGTKPGARLPVLVWFQGGANTQGTGVIYGGGSMATRSDVVVTINYRLGVLGTLNLPQLRAESKDGPGNYGLLDQQAALRWVHSNISRFGGDPDNVTIAGQSAGAGSVCDHLASPTAKGLFSRAVIMSGGCNLQSAASGQGQSTAFVEEVGCATAADVLACLRAKPAAELLAAQKESGVSLSTGGRAFPVSPATAVQTGAFGSR